MLASRSAIYKMVREDYAERKIHFLPRPFLSAATPYKQIGFSKIVSLAASSVTAGLNISKAIFVGDVAVGKTSLVNRFCHSIFETNYKATIGVDFEVERFDIVNVPFNLQIWDTAGQERFKCIAQSYYRGASAVIVVFSLCDPATLKHAKTWLDEALKANTLSPLVFLVGTKRDKVSSASYMSIETEAIRMANNELNAEYWAVSSKTGDCVNNLFNRIAALSFETAIQKEYEVKGREMVIGNPMMLKMENNMRTSNKKKGCANCKI